jgi:hypothetical protein
MDEVDKARKTPDHSRPRSVPVDNIPHQRVAPPANMQAPHISNTSLPSAIPVLGTSVLGKRKATETSLLNSDHTSTTDGVPQQPSLEQPSHSRGVTPTPDTKRRRLKSESLEQKYPESPDSSGSGLFVGRSATSRASPHGTLNLRRPTLSEAGLMHRGFHSTDAANRGRADRSPDCSSTLCQRFQWPQSRSLRHQRGEESLKSLYRPSEFRKGDTNGGYSCRLCPGMRGTSSRLLQRTPRY